MLTQTGKKTSKNTTRPYRKYYALRINQHGFRHRTSEFVLSATFCLLSLQWATVLGQFTTLAAHLAQKRYALFLIVKWYQFVCTVHQIRGQRKHTACDVLGPAYKLGAPVTNSLYSEEYLKRLFSLYASETNVRFCNQCAQWPSHSPSHSNRAMSGHIRYCCSRA